MSNTPSLKDRIKTFAYAMWYAFLLWLSGDKVMSPLSLQYKRFAICAMCKYNKNGFCESCGCWLRFKRKLVFSECPEGKW